MKNYNTPLIEKAANFIIDKHKGQVRKYTNEPYYEHPFMVRGILTEVSAPENSQVAALLHDTLEDTDTTYEELITEFNQEVADLVKEVTKVSRPEDGDRAKRKAKDTVHLSKSSYWGATIKLSDIIANCSNIAELDPIFAKTYLQEKLIQLQVLNHGNKALLLLASACIEIGLQQLEIAELKGKTK